MVLNEEAVDEEKEDGAEIVGILSDVVREVPLLGPASEIVDADEVVDVRRLVGVAKELDGVPSPLPPKIGRLTLAHSSLEHPELEGCGDGGELALLKPAAVMVSDEKGVVLVVDGVSPTPGPSERHKSPVQDDTTDDAVVEGAFPPSRPSEIQRSPLQVDAVECDSTVAKVVGTLPKEDVKGGERVNVCVIV